MVRWAVWIAMAYAIFSTGSASGHVTLETREAPANANYKAVLRVSHGCGGSPTTAIRVRIPDGVTGVKPMLKPGWDVSVKVAPYDKPYRHRDEVLTEGGKEIIWSGGQLLDGYFDEFIFRAMLPDEKPGTMLYFPVVQHCAKGVHRWIEIPDPGKSPKDLEEPAPALRLIEKAQ